MADQNALQRLFQQYGCRDFRWIDPAEIVVAQWVRLKCTFGCESYGRNAACPPNTPPVHECRQLLDEYRIAAIFRFPVAFNDADERSGWTRKMNLELLKLEGEVIAAGHPKAFLLFVDSCNICKDCAKTRTGCRNIRMARPSAQGMAIDVIATAARFGYPGEQDGGRNYSFLLLE
ncbi:DUF2284 domain-containing protein [Geomonas sp. RF6]|uniref:DUF2284 domain-containing protein n=1 Tax=Geomonas sp. RF6 TaxID=2897342 RepID=UPI001E3C674E|nr:DUF2284 domain-containing protein [Geomonas sp. RF6]UFS70575.1 DUF2284 domain-containing protein [Geomonas sp. RF6]